METTIDMISLAELQRNIRNNGKTVAELIKLYKLTELGREAWLARFESIEDRVLADNEFFAGMNVERFGVKIGDRITSHKRDWLLSRDDFDTLQQLLVAEYCKEGLTDAKGYYTDNWDDKVCEARNALYTYICDNILPAAIRAPFWEARWSVIKQDKLIKVVEEALFGK